MLHATPHQRPPTQHFIPPFFQLPTELSPDEKYPPLIHTQPLIPGQVYIPHVGGDGSALPSPSSTRCSSSTLALRDNDTRKIFTSCRSGPDRMLTPPLVCEKREQLMTRELLMMSSHAYPYAAPFYAVNQSRNRDDGNQKHEDLSRPPLRHPPPPLEVALYCSLRRIWNKHFMYGLQSPDLPAMRFHARRLVHCNCIWDEDELLHLSRAFLWRASGLGESATPLLAAFAWEVYQVFHSALSIETGGHFRCCMWYVLRETFISSWHFEEQRISRQAVTYIKNPSPGYKEYVVSALSVCSFIGDLFRYDFITRSDTVGCIRGLLHNLTTVEHVTAIRNILKHAGILLWHQALNLDAEVWQFRTVLLAKSKALKDHRTVLQQPINGDARVRSSIIDILAHMEECCLVVRGG